MSNENFVDRFVHRKFADLTERRIKQYTHDYATDRNGTVDQGKAQHIDLELRRRLGMGFELDYKEPMRWTVEEKIPLTIAAAVAVKYFTAPPVRRTALWALAATSAIPSLIELIRIPTRFDAGLTGGLNTALAMDALDKTQALDTKKDSVVGYWTRNAQAPGASASSR